MKRTFTFMLSACVVAIGLAGCAEKASTEKKTTVKTPEGTTEKTEKTEVKKTGDNPPPVK